MLVNGNQIRDPDGTYPVSIGSPTIVVTCRLNGVNPQPDTVLIRIIKDSESILSNDYTQLSFSGHYTLIKYTLNSTDKQHLPATYRCRDSAPLACPDYVQVTLYTQQKPSSRPVIASCPPGTTSSHPSTNPSSVPVTSKLR